MNDDGLCVRVMVLIDEDHAQEVEDAVKGWQRTKSTRIKTIGAELSWACPSPIEIRYLILSLFIIMVVFL